MLGRTRRGFERNNFYKQSSSIPSGSLTVGAQQEFEAAVEQALEAPLTSGPERADDPGSGNRDILSQRLAEGALSFQA